ncbi:MAG: MgtC/SapB family protein [Nanoarchaeota archaeon]|nr:MgtC/SapB family protein [Nanoarchaeota archaeon]
MSDISTLDIIIRLLVVFVLSAIIGFEREWYRKPAGLRTIVLVGVGSALFTLVSFRIQDLFPNSTIDPGRISAQVVTGIGFLCAGAIIRARGSIIGLTTAASVFTVAAIGMAAAYGLFIEAIATTILVLITFYGLSYIVDIIRKHSKIQPIIKDEIDNSSEDVN